MSAGTSILSSFEGALQASLAVLLTIGYGAVASRYGLLRESSTRDISKTCVRFFLPALLITNVGSEIHAQTAYIYVPVLIWALFYTLSSMLLGWLLRRAFPRKFPAWAIPAICFNNTTALPLVLIQSLDSSGILKQLFKDDTDSSASAVSRAKSYFLVASVVGNCLTFAVGPKLLDDEDSPDEDQPQTKDQQYVGANGNAESDEEHANPTNSDGRIAEEEEEHTNESTSLLPDRVARQEERWEDEATEETDRYLSKLPRPLEKFVVFCGSLVNAPLIGAIIGAFLGLIPALHKAFFNEPDEGGFFKGWLTSSVKNVGELFPALQLVVVGAKLSGSLVKMKKGEASGNVRWIPCSVILFIRFLLWPIISITVIYFVASKTTWLADDPILWFVLMLIPTGPPATKLAALADVSRASDEEKMSIAKFITISYVCSPVICLAVVASLRVSVMVAEQ